MSREKQRQAVAGQRDKLLSILNQSKGGKKLFTDAEVRHYLPMLILRSRTPPDQLSPAVSQLLGEFALEAKLDPRSSAEELSRAIDVYYQKHPANPALVQAVERFLQNPDQAVHVVDWALSKSGRGWSK